MSSVHVRLQTDAIHMEFRGSQALFERVVDPILLAFATGRPASVAPRISRAKQEETGGPEVRGQEENGSEGGAADNGSHYNPPSDTFHTFQRQLEPGKDAPANRVAAYAFFLWNYEKKESFEEDEVTGCFLAEGLPVPEALGDAYDELSRRRILAPGRRDGAWELTAKGRDHVRHHLLSA